MSLLPKLEDEYLQPAAAFNRLVKEYFKYGSLFAAYDFDGTVFDFHNSGATHENVRQLIRDLKEIDCTVICWTATDNHERTLKFLNDNNIPCDGINLDGINLGWTSRKPMYSFLLDDRAGLIEVYSMVRNVVDYINEVLNADEELYEQHMIYIENNFQIEVNKKFKK